MSGREEFAKALRAKLEVPSDVTEGIYFRVFASAYKQIISGVDKYNYIMTMARSNDRLGEEGKKALKEIRDMPEYKAWIE